MHVCNTPWRPYFVVLTLGIGKLIFLLRAYPKLWTLVNFTECKEYLIDLKTNFKELHLIICVRGIMLLIWYINLELVSLCRPKINFTTLFCKITSVLRIYLPVLPQINAKYDKCEWTNA